MLKITWDKNFYDPKRLGERALNNNRRERIAFGGAQAELSKSLRM